METLRKQAGIEVEQTSQQLDRAEEEVLDCLTAESPDQRIRGLDLLAKMGAGDLFNWCTMYLADESKEVVISALQTMSDCVDGDAEVIVPYADAADKQIRAAAIAALAKHSGMDAHRWVEHGLRDSEAYVRLQTAVLLPQLDSTEHRNLFELALRDRNPEVKKLAQKAINGIGG